MEDIDMHCEAILEETLNIESNLNTYDGIFKMLCQRNLHIFKNISIKSYDAALSMIEATKEKYKTLSKQLSKFNSVKKARLELKMNVVLLSEIVCKYKENNENVKSFDFKEFKRIFKEQYDKTMDDIFVRGLLCEIFNILWEAKYFRLAKFILELDMIRYHDMKYPSGDALGNYLKFSESLMFHNKLCYIDAIFRWSAKVKSGYILNEDDMEREALDTEKSEFLSELITKNLKPEQILPNKLVETYEEAQEMSKRIMKEVLLLESKVSSYNPEDLELNESEQHFLNYRNRADFYRGLVHYLTAIFCEKPSVQEKLLKKSLQFYLQHKKYLIDNESDGSLKQLDSDIDNVYMLMIQINYETLQNVREEDYNKKIESLKKILHSRIAHGTAFLNEIIEDIPDDFGVAERVPKIYNDMAMWARLIFNNEEMAKEFESKLKSFPEYPKIRNYSKIFND